MDLSQLGEFGFIELIKRKIAQVPLAGCEGIGDDCAVIPIGGNESFVVTTDMLIEDIHFLRDKIRPYLLGRKSLAVNLSDIAAMGATPIASFLSIALPGDITCEWAEEFIDGYNSLSETYNVPLLGGDTTSSSGKIAINITAIGRVKNENIKRRNAAISGDKLFVSGYLGGSSQGLLDVLSGVAESPYMDEHNDPKPYVREGEWLGLQSAVHAMMDVSDGIASDLKHILKASHVGAEVLLDMIPANVAVKLAVAGGEDYKLLFTVEATSAAELCERYKRHFGSDLYEIGRIVAGEPEIIWLNEGDVAVPETWSGFTHF